MNAGADEVIETAQRLGVTLATAESLTGGAVSTALTRVPGASTVVRGGIVAYASDLKVSLLGVPASVVAEHGVVSAACAAAMATGVRDHLGATYGIATTGVAGPGEQEGKSVGTVFVALAGPAGVRSLQLALSGTRDEIRAATVTAALDFSLRVLRREEPEVG